MSSSRYWAASINSNFLAASVICLRVRSIAFSSAFGVMYCTTSALGSQQPKNNFYVEPEPLNIAADPVVQYMTPKALEKTIERTRKQMIEAAKKLEFIEAAQYRDELIKLEQRLNDTKKS